MPDQPLAFFLNFTTYGAWLHGKAAGSVDREHNEYETPFLPPDKRAEGQVRAAMTQPAFVLDHPRRRVVLAAIQEVCAHRGWFLIACHVRLTHVHVLVSADVPRNKP